jgi:hypothetical protein
VAYFTRVAHVQTRQVAERLRTTLQRASEHSGQPLDSSEMEVLDEIITSKHKTSGACPITRPAATACPPTRLACRVALRVSVASPWQRAHH